MRFTELIIIVLILKFNLSFSQTIVSTPLKRGLFRTFEDFKYNRPDTTMAFGFDPEKENLSIDTTKKVARKMNLWGFCDGNDVYFIGRKISKLETIDRYCYFEQKGVAVGTVGGGRPPVLVPIPQPYHDRYVLNLNNGNTYNLDNNLMKTILKKDPELLEQFEKEKQKKDKYLFYIKAYNERHKDELKEN